MGLEKRSQVLIQTKIQVAKHRKRRGGKKIGQNFKKNLKT